MTKIWAHTLVRNEERYLWFSIMSVVDFVDKILLWDTGSTDNTLRIIEDIIKKIGKKIDFRQAGQVDSVSFTTIRQKMLEDTKSDWFLILDGDEVWWRDSIKRVVETIQNEGKDLEALVVPFYDIVGDIYHFQEEKAGQYKIDGKKGHLSIKAVNRNIEGLHFNNPYGQEGLFDKEGSPIQNRSSSRRKYLNTPFMHFTNMIRSSSHQQDKKVLKRGFKYKYELGQAFPKGFKYPEVFSMDFPKYIPSPWTERSKSYLVKSAILSGPRWIKRRVITSKSGY